MPGKVYSGEAGYGPYYQLRINTKVDDLLAGLRLGQKLTVRIYRESENESVMAALALAH